MDFAYLMITFLQLHPRKPLVLQSGSCCGLHFNTDGQQARIIWSRAEPQFKSQKMLLPLGKWKHIRPDEVGKQLSEVIRRREALRVPGAGGLAPSGLHSAQDSENSLSFQLGVCVTKCNCVSSDVPGTPHSVVYRPEGAMIPSWAWPQSKAQLRDSPRWMSLTALAVQD